jgi:hypothetical protein
MDSKSKALWVAALRSGGYQQITGQLRDSDGYCCLGVLLNCTGEGVPADEVELTEEDMKRYGITVKQQQRLIDMNDIKRKPFTAIADYIEQHL